MKIITLIENLVYQNGLQAEHGLSLYIEDDAVHVLFDTGQSDNFIQNAEKLNIDLKKIDYVVISHGHYDHTGGLSAFLEINSKAKIIIKEKAFQNKVSSKDEKLRYIGMPINKVDIQNRIFLLDDSKSLSEHITIEPHIKIYDEFDTHFEYMKIKIDTKLLNDTFEDELYLTIKKNNDLSIVSGCSHRGISNIVMSALDKNPNSHLHTVIGGFHLKNYNYSKNKKIIDFFKEKGVHRLGLCHCTGIESYSDFKNSLGKIVFYNHTAREIDFFD